MGKAVKKIYPEFTEPEIVDKVFAQKAGKGEHTQNAAAALQTLSPLSQTSQSPHLPLILCSLKEPHNQQSSIFTMRIYSNLLLYF